MCSALQHNNMEGNVAMVPLPARHDERVGHYVIITQTVSETSSSSWFHHNHYHYPHHPLGNWQAEYQRMVQTYSGMMNECSPSLNGPFDACPLCVYLFLFHFFRPHKSRERNSTWPNPCTSSVSVMVVEYVHTYIYLKCRGICAMGRGGRLRRSSCRGSAVEVERQSNRKRGTKTNNKSLRVKSVSLGFAYGNSSCQGAPFRRWYVRMCHLATAALVEREPMRGRPWLFFLSLDNFRVGGRHSPRLSTSSNLTGETSTTTWREWFSSGGHVLWPSIHPPPFNYFQRSCSSALKCWCYCDVY